MRLICKNCKELFKNDMFIFLFSEENFEDLLCVSYCCIGYRRDLSFNCSRRERVCFI